MELILTFLNGVHLEPLRNLLSLFSFPPERLGTSLIFLFALMLSNDLLRTALMVQATRSVPVHALIDTLTLWPGIALAAALLYAGALFPDRVWINLGLACALYTGWILGGTLTRLSRSDTEGADIGWISHGFVITLAGGLTAAVLF